MAAYFGQGDKDAKILPPSKKLQDKLGSNTNLDDLVTEETIEKAQATVMNTLELFISNTEEDLKTLEMIATQKLDATTSGPKAVQKVLDPAFSIKSRAGVYGYELASAIARSLYNYMEDLTKLEEHDLIIVQAHVKALRGIFANNITGDGDKIGEELMNSLDSLVAKYRD